MRFCACGTRLVVRKCMHACSRILMDARPLLIVAGRFGVGPLQPGEKPAEVGIFRHSLLHHFMCSIFCKMPIQPMTKMGHLRQLFMLRIILSVFQFRVNKRCAARCRTGLGHPQVPRMKPALCARCASAFASTRPFGVCRPGPRSCPALYSLLS